MTTSTWTEQQLQTPKAPTQVRSGDTIVGYIHNHTLHTDRSCPQTPAADLTAHPHAVLASTTRPICKTCSPTWSLISRWHHLHKSDDPRTKLILKAAARGTSTNANYAQQRWLTHLSEQAGYAPTTTPPKPQRLFLCQSSNIPPTRLQQANIGDMFKVWDPIVITHLSKVTRHLWTYNARGLLHAGTTRPEHELDPRRFVTGRIIEPDENIDHLIQTALWVAGNMFGDATWTELLDVTYELAAAP